jgi:hypothetical protein
MIPEEGDVGLSLAEAVLAINDQISRLDESQSRNSDEVLKFPASELLVEQIKDVMHFIPERNPIFKILRRYITDDRSVSEEMRIVDVLPVLEALHSALANERNRRLKNSDERQGGAVREEPGGGIEMHHRPRPQLPRGPAYRPESAVGGQNELTWLRPFRKPK